MRCVGNTAQRRQRRARMAAAPHGGQAGGTRQPARSVRGEEGGFAVRYSSAGGSMSRTLSDESGTRVVVAVVVQGRYMRHRRRV